MADVGSEIITIFSLPRVYVTQSLISSAGEGLFAKVAVGPNTVMAFYNGVRITHQEVSAQAKLNIVHPKALFQTRSLSSSTTTS
jgi:hypothetical protein